MSHSWSTNPRPGSSTENGTTSAIRGSPRSSPHSSSWNTSSRVVSQDGSLSASPGIGSTGAVNEENASAVGSEASSSMVTADIVKEVQRLSQFVKSYEKKKEYRIRRERDRGDDVNMSNSLASSMDYDSLMETVASLQQVVDPAGTATKTEYFEDEITRKGASTTLGVGFSNSPERAMSRQLDGIESMQSSDSSDIVTMESDDLSRRLGITPFSVQNPATLQNPPVHSISHIASAYYQRASSPPEKSPASSGGGGGHNTYRQVTPRLSNKQPTQQSTLSALRHSGTNMLDGSVEGPPDEFVTNDTDRPFNPSTIRDPRTVAPRKRSNGNLSNVISMFEAKERQPIYPPNESWQYNY